MSLHSPWFLLALLLVPALLWAVRLAGRRRRDIAVVRMPALDTLRAVATRSPSHRRWLPVALFAVALAFLAVGLSRPERPVSVPSKRTSVMLVTDASRSMLATDVPPNRLVAAVTAAKRFLSSVPSSTRVGLVGYSTTPHTIVPPTADRDEMRRALDGLEADGGTATGDALSIALDALQSEGEAAITAGRTPGAVLLLSDGRTSNGANPVEVATLARRLRIPIYTVALGTPNGTFEAPGGFGTPGGGFGGGTQTVRAPPDPETLRRIAERSGGQAFTVDDADELRRIYARLGARVGSEMEEQELTAVFAGLGLVALLAAVGLGVRWRPRPL